MSDTSINVVDSILNMVMDIYTPPERDIEVVYIPVNRPDENISEALRNFNPETHVIVTKELLDITNQLKALGDVVFTVDKIMDKINGLGVQVDEIHSVQTGKFLNPKTSKPSKAEQEKLRLQKLYNQGLRNVLNRK